MLVGRAYAVIRGRDYVTPDDIKAIAPGGARAPRRRAPRAVDERGLVAQHRRRPAAHRADAAHRGAPVVSSAWRPTRALGRATAVGVVAPHRGRRRWPGRPRGARRPARGPRRLVARDPADRRARPCASRLSAEVAPRGRQRSPGGSTSAPVPGLRDVVGAPAGRPVDDDDPRRTGTSARARGRGPRDDRPAGRCRPGATAGACAGSARPRWAASATSPPSPGPGRTQRTETVATVPDAGRLHLARRAPPPRGPGRPAPQRPGRRRYRARRDPARSAPATGCAASTGRSRCAPAPCT